MDIVVQPGSVLWQYISPEQRMLLADGMHLVTESDKPTNGQMSDYSYLVFPFAKLYEGFLKQLLRDLGIIDDRLYRSDHYRIGKALSPNLARRLGDRSAYQQLANAHGQEIGDELWNAWKQGRNLIFHYFPHNFRSLTHEEAKERIHTLLSAMDRAVAVTHVRPQPHP